MVLGQSGAKHGLPFGVLLSKAFDLRVVGSKGNRSWRQRPRPGCSGGNARSADAASVVVQFREEHIGCSAGHDLVLFLSCACVDLCALLEELRCTGSLGLALRGVVMTPRG